jgi:hypothetical protein
LEIANRHFALSRDLPQYEVVVAFFDEPLPCRGKDFLPPLQSLAGF